MQEDLPRGQTWRVLSHLLMQWKWKAWLQTPTNIIEGKYHNYINCRQLKH